MITTGAHMESCDSRDWFTSLFTSWPVCSGFGGCARRPATLSDNRGKKFRTYSLKTLSDAKISVLKSYLQNFGSFTYNLDLPAGFMLHSDNSWGSFWTNACKNIPFKLATDDSSCCYKYTKKECNTFGYSCKNNYASKCTPSKGGHSMRVVGWDTYAGQDYWLVQNSWGSSWFEGGYIKIYIKNHGVSWVNGEFDGNEYNSVAAYRGEFGLAALEDAHHPVQLGHPVTPQELLVQGTGTSVPVPIVQTRFEIVDRAQRLYNCSVLNPADEGVSNNPAVQAESIKCLARCVLQCVI
jgi:hypothetical protein